MKKDPPASEITPEATWRRRREFLRDAGLFGLTATGIGGSLLWLIGGPRVTKEEATEAAATASAVPPLEITARKEMAGGETPTPFDAITTYNNFYEFGLDKGDPVVHARRLRTRPWTITIDGEVGKPETIDVDELVRRFPLEERVYRMRCVEAWSMVIPWLGFPLGALLKRAKPTSQARYVALQTLHDPEQMPGQGWNTLEWPYVEGLRLDEAMHPLTLLAVGLYGRELPNQNGAPIRLVVPWKYGFKGVKSIVRISLVRDEPKTAWNVAAPHEYGFFANVNPEVDHPRWSQASERRIGDFARRPTLPFNGYGEEVASLYSGMDLRRFF